MSTERYIENYEMTGDVCTFILGVLLFILLRTTYSLKDRKYRYFCGATGILVVDSVIRIVYMHLLDLDIVKYRMTIIGLRTFYFVLLSVVLLLYLLYIMELVKTHSQYKRILLSLAIGGYLVYVGLSQYLSLTRKEFFIDMDGNMSSQMGRISLFYYYYFFMILLIGISLVIYKKMLITKVRRCIMAGTIVTVMVVVIQIYYWTASLLTFTFIIPVIMVGFIFHNHGRDVLTGALDYRAFLAYFKDFNKETRGYISLYLDKISQEKLLTLSEHFYHFNDGFFKENTVFQLDDQRFLMMCRKKKNKNFADTMPSLLDAFMKLYDAYGVDFKVLWGEQRENFKDGKSFYHFIRFKEESMRLNTVRQTFLEDYYDYEKVHYLIHELEDIYNKRDLEDPRVKVFCQPVLNTTTKRYSTAEALMRLQTERYGMIFPDTFIPLAESHECIHVLSEIILHKTCMFIRNAMQEGKNIDRISVNISPMELKNRNFCDDIVKIIKDCQIPFDKIAIELTESTNEADFEKVKDIMFELHRYGIKFYLDDFGTGYSNIERIIGLPIDIIKFDRSLTILASKDDTSQSIVASFSNIFKMAEYQVLFEGVEDEADENRCMEMNAHYLQGYKYSKPIPIEELKKFLR